MAQLAPLVGGGWKHWFDHAPRHRDHFLTQARPDGTADCRSLSCVEYAGLSRGIVADLLDADGEALVTGRANWWADSWSKPVGREMRAGASQQASPGKGAATKKK